MGEGDEMRNKGSSEGMQKVPPLLDCQLVTARECTPPIATGGGSGTSKGGLREKGEGQKAQTQA